MINIANLLNNLNQIKQKAKPKHKAKEGKFGQRTRSFILQDCSTEGSKPSIF